MKDEQLSFCPDSWDELLLRAQAGDQEALNTLMLETRPWLYSIASRKLPPELAEEAVQNTQLIFLVNLHKLKPGNLKGWLYRVLHHEILRLLKREQ